jgi:glycosyltransferase involved in cell wall biosynthesis
MAAPAVSVIIPVYNRADYIGDAVASIRSQTFGDFELLVVDDGSTDSTVDRVRSIRDPRVRLVRHESNRGIPASRNTGLDHARGAFIAWLDSDDIARPRRLEEQVGFLRSNPGVALVGACAGKINPSGMPRRGTRVPPLSSADIGAWLLFRTPFQQSSVTGRAEILKHYRYREENPVLEDLDMFIRIGRDHPLRNLPSVLIDRRIHREQSIRLHTGTLLDRGMALLAAQLDGLGMIYSEDDLRRHVLLGKPWFGGFRPDGDFLRWARSWMQRLRHANDRTRRVDSDALRFATGFFWLVACHAAVSSSNGIRAARIFSSSSLAGGLASRRGWTWLRQALPLVIAGQRSRSGAG